MNASILLDGASFEDSRRLTGPNRHFAESGAVLETLLDAPLSADVVQRWRLEIDRAREFLGWPQMAADVRLSPRGASLAIAAPIDQLYTATEVNEWAWQRAVGRNESMHAPGHAALADLDSGLQTLQRLAAAESNVSVLALQRAAQLNRVPMYVDDDTLSLGEGVSSQSFSIGALPTPDVVCWSELRAIPKALVTGSNGKTTSVRLLAAMAKVHGWCTGHTCTDGLFVDGCLVEAGDFSGPGGARAILRHPDVDAAVLEAARGGLLRRGVGVGRADVALVTNVSADHFGEYGIHDLDALADVKLSLAKAIDQSGTLVLNADDATLLRKSQRIVCALAWFALDDAHPMLLAHRARGGGTCGVRERRLVLTVDGDAHDLGLVDSMPLAMAGLAAYNIANLAGAALSAFKLGIAPAAISRVLGDFGSRRKDNPGRLQIWQLGELSVFLDYAHNPDGLDGFLSIAEQARGAGRLGLLLGQAGNRDNADVRALADVAARHRPDRIVLKDIDGYMRGRRSGEVAEILHAQLLYSGVPASAIEILLDEADAAVSLIRWARPGDVIALPIHATPARNAISDWLDRLESSGWRPGQHLPVVAADALAATPSM